MKLKLMILIFSIFSLTIFGQEKYNEIEKLVEINNLMSEGKGNTKWKISFSGDNLILQATQGGPKQIFPLKEMSPKKIKFTKKGKRNYKDFKVTRYIFNFRPIKGGGVYWEAFKKKMNRALFHVSFVEKDQAKRLHILLVELIKHKTSK